MNEKITVLVVESGKTPYTKAIDSGLKSLQQDSIAKLHIEHTSFSNPSGVKYFRSHGML